MERRIGGGGFSSRVLLVALSPCVFLLFACGYRAVYGGDSPQRLHVKLVRSLVVDAVASDEVASGVREELARAGALEGGDGWPRVDVEVLRTDTDSEGIAAAPSGPVARATDVAVVARAWVEESPGSDPRADTGDMRAEDVVAVDSPGGAPDPRADVFHHADALRASARRLGHSLARKVLGLPAPSDPGPGLSR
jgi:hypothetical protein